MTQPLHPKYLHNLNRESFVNRFDFVSVGRRQEIAGGPHHAGRQAQGLQLFQLCYFFQIEHA